MKVSSIIGIEKNGVIISENNFEQHNILNTRGAITEYFDKYGYEFVESYDLSRNLVIVQDKNLEVSLFLGLFYKSFAVIDYRTCEVISSKIMPNEFRQPETRILNINYRIVQWENGYRLIRYSDGAIIVEADYMTFIGTGRLMFRKCSIDYIMELESYEIFPLIKQEPQIYQGPNPNNMVDFRRGMYYQNQKSVFPIDIAKVNIDYLIAKFPYGEKKGKLFQLLSDPIRFGLLYEDSKETHEVWYDSAEERDQIYSTMQEQIAGIFDSEKQKKLKKVDN